LGGRLEIVGLEVTMKMSGQAFEELEDKVTDFRSCDAEAALLTYLLIYLLY